MIATVDIARVRARFPRAFGSTPLTRALRWLGASLCVVWLIALCVWFDITPARLSRGISGLFVILRQMIPPSPGAQWRDILQGLAESVAMAFLGTFVAAVIAFPLGFASVLPASVVLGGVLLVVLLYFVVADFLYVGRLAAYVAILELPEIFSASEPSASPDGSPPSALSIQPRELVDQNELILSDVPANS